MSKSLCVLLALVIIAATIAAYLIGPPEEPAPIQDPLYYLPDGSMRPEAWEVARIDTVSIERCIENTGYGYYDSTGKPSYYYDTTWVPVCTTIYRPISPWEHPVLPPTPEYRDPLYYLADGNRRPEAWAVDSLVMMGCEKRPAYNSVDTIYESDSWSHSIVAHSTPKQVDSTWVDIYDTIWKKREVVFE